MSILTFCGAVQRALREEGTLRECVDCRHWTPGQVVYRGNTQGTCGRWYRGTGADWTCDEHARAGMREAPRRQPRRQQPLAPPVVGPEDPDAIDDIPARPQPFWTAERVELLRALWPDPDLSLLDIRHRLNKLPGGYLYSGVTVRARAMAEGLPARETQFVTPGRRYVFERLWADPEVSNAAIVRAMNRLHGPTLQPGDLYTIANVLGMPPTRADARGQAQPEEGGE